MGRNFLDKGGVKGISLLRGRENIGNNGTFSVLTIVWDKVGYLDDFMELLKGRYG